MSDVCWCMHASGHPSRVISQEVPGPISFKLGTVIRCDASETDFDSKLFLHVLSDFNICLTSCIDLTTNSFHILNSWYSGYV